MCPVVLNMCRISQGDQHVHIEQEPSHGNSSRSRRTSSDVTRGLPGCKGKRGTPLRAFPRESAGRNARLASAEITSPTLFRCVAASSRAAANTSSSIARVVRIMDFSATSRINNCASACASKAACDPARPMPPRGGHGKEKRFHPWPRSIRYALTSSSTWARASTESFCLLAPIALPHPGSA